MTPKNTENEAMTIMVESLQRMNIALQDASQSLKNRRLYGQYTRAMGGERKPSREDFDDGFPYDEAVRWSAASPLSLEDIYFMWLGLQERPSAKSTSDHMKDLALFSRQ